MVTVNQRTGMSRDTSKSDQIVQRFHQRTFRSKRTLQEFSGTFETTVEELFPLLCPAREADWIPEWDCELIYTDSGYAEENCIFKTEKSNPVGEGLWMFTGFKVNHYVDFVRLQEDVIMHARITVADNNDGTVTATWNIVTTGLTEKGNRQVDGMSETPHSGAVVKLLDHYLKEGKMIKQSSLALGMLAQIVKGHFANQGH